MDWSGNKNSVFKTLGATNHTDREREANDFYATDPIAIDRLLSAYTLPKGQVWECACGQGHLAKRLIELGYNVVATDLIDRGYGRGDVNFFLEDIPSGVNTILTNPPYKYAADFVLRALDVLPDKGVCAMLLRTLALEGSDRYERIYKNTPPNMFYNAPRGCYVPKTASSTRFAVRAVRRWRMRGLSGLKMIINNQKLNGYEFD
jgi:hypothetical protein